MLKCFDRSEILSHQHVFVSYFWVYVSHLGRVPFLTKKKTHIAVIENVSGQYVSHTGQTAQRNQQS